MRFTAELRRFPGKGGWHFVALPSVPEVFGAFGRLPVEARVEGFVWSTSVWKDRRHGAILPVPARARRGLALGEHVRVEIRPAG